MKSTIKIIALTVIILSANSNQAQSLADTSAIKNIIEQETTAWNKGDAKAYSQYFASDGSFTNILGSFFVGYVEFLSRHEQIFKGPFKGTKMTQKIVSLRFVRQDLAIVETITWIDGFSENGPPKGTFLDEKGRLRTRLVQVVAQDGSSWKIVNYHNVDVKPGIVVPEP